MKASWPHDSTLRAVLLSRVEVAGVVVPSVKCSAIHLGLGGRESDNKPNCASIQVTHATFAAMFNSITLIWFGCGLWAVYMLVGMMRRRQLYLIDLLKQHVEIQSAWARRRDLALKLAESAKAETEEKKAKVVKLANEITSQASEAA